MTWTTAYGPASLDSDGSLGANYTYVVRIPAADVTATDEGLRIGMRGPASGSSRIQSMWVGHPGAGVGFDGTQKRVTFTVQNVVTLGNGLIWSDFVAFEIDPSKDLLIAYELLSGDNYRRNISMDASFSLSYKAGSGDAGSTSKSGYTTNTGRTALIEKIEVGPAPEVSVIPTGGALEMVLAGKCHSAGGRVAGQSGKYLHFQVQNPADSDLPLLVTRVDMALDSASDFTIRSISSPLTGSVLPECNRRYGAGPSPFVASWSLEDTVKGNWHSSHVGQADEIEIVEFADGSPIVVIEPGRQALIVVDQPGVGALCNVYWTAA